MDFSKLISHRFRGFSEFENSLEGLNSALSFGVRQIEFDIRLARCGTPMIYHDESARDGSGKSRYLCEIMARDFADIGGDFCHIPTAEQLFSDIARHSNKNCILLVDIKDAGVETALYALAKSFGLIERIIWVSWLPEVLYAMYDIEAAQSFCFSHWCRRPGRWTRAIHHVFSADKGHIQRPSRKMVVGERSGWFVDGAVRGDLRRILTHVCVPANQVWPDLVTQYQTDGIQVSAFSYTRKKAIESESKRLKLDAYFIDNKILFEEFKPR